MSLLSQRTGLLAVGAFNLAIFCVGILSCACFLHDSRLWTPQEKGLVAALMFNSVLSLVASVVLCCRSIKQVRQISMFKLKIYFCSGKRLLPNPLDYFDSEGTFECSDSVILCQGETILRLSWVAFWLLFYHGFSEYVGCPIKIGQFDFNKQWKSRRRNWAWTNASYWHL